MYISKSIKYLLLVRKEKLKYSIFSGSTSKQKKIYDKKITKTSRTQL